MAWYRHSYERRASSSSATTLGENASLQVRRKAVRRQNWSRTSRLPAVASPSTLFFSFPFFSSFFFFLFWLSKMEKSCNAAASRRGGEQQRPASSVKKKMELRAPETTQPKTTSFWVGLIFFLKSKHPKTTSFWGYCFF